MFEVTDATGLVASEAPKKFVLRMTGAGALTATLQAPDSSEHALEWGPEPHSSSNYGRPGDEWGTGLRFDAPGCWGLHLTREDEGSASFWYEVR